MATSGAEDITDEKTSSATDCGGQGATDATENQKCVQELDVSLRLDAEANGITSADDEVSAILLHDAAGGDNAPETDIVGEVVTEIIMSKTFTESIAPDREFMPISGENSEQPAAQNKSVVYRSPVVSTTVSSVDRKLSEHDTAPSSSSEETSKLTTESTSPEKSSSDAAAAEQIPRAETDASQTTSADVGEEDPRLAVSIAAGQVRDLTDEFRRLQDLLDCLSSPQRTFDGEDDDLSSDENVDAFKIKDGNVKEDVAASGQETVREQTRVVYRYRIHTSALETGKRWISRPRTDEDLTCGELPVSAAAAETTPTSEVVANQNDSVAATETSNAASVPPVTDIGCTSENLK